MTLSVKSCVSSWPTVETHHKGLVEIDPQHVLHETRGCVLLEIEARSTDPLMSMSRPIFKGRSVSRRKFTMDSTRLVVVEEMEIVLREVANKFSVLVSCNKKHIYFIDTLADG